MIYIYFFFENYIFFFKYVKIKLKKYSFKIIKSKKLYPHVRNLVDYEDAEFVTKSKFQIL